MSTGLDLALAAIVRNNATDEAYRVAAEQSWFELVPGIIYQGETSQMSPADQLELSASQARSIIKQAKKDEMYDADEPGDDATCIKEAGTLVDMAEQAWAQYIRGPEVEAILKLANRAPEGDDAEAEQNGAAAHEPEPEAAAEPEVEPDDDNEQAPKQDLSDVPENLKTVEPWQDYKKDTTASVTNGINVLVEENPDDLADVLGHIWAYESANKNRVKIIKHVKAAWEAARPGQAAPVEEPTPEPEAAAEEPTPEPTPEPKAAEKPEVKESPQQVDAEDDVAYRTLREGVERQLVQERLQVPKPPTEEVPDLPWHWHDISSQDLHNFYGYYSAMGYYKSYIVSREERLAMHCRSAADELAGALLVKMGAVKDAKVTLIQAQIESDEHVKTWRKRQRKHELFAAQAKREMESYQKLTEQLSRMETMKQNAYLRSTGAK